MANLNPSPMTNPKPLNVLFLCTHNSARSIMAEAMLNHLGKGRFRAFSAGSSPREQQQPHPLALAALERVGVPTKGLRSKSWDEYGQESATHMDLVITVCDNAAGEVCPLWPGHPATAHWGYADPSEVEGNDAARQQAFRKTLMEIRQRLEAFINLPASAIEKLALQQSARDLASR